MLNILSPPFCHLRAGEQGLAYSGIALIRQRTLSRETSSAVPDPDTPSSRASPTGLPNRQSMRRRGNPLGDPEGQHSTQSTPRAPHAGDTGRQLKKQGSRISFAGDFTEPNRHPMRPSAGGNEALPSPSSPHSNDSNASSPTGTRPRSAAQPGVSCSMTLDSPRSVRGWNHADDPSPTPFKMQVCRLEMSSQVF